MELLETRFARKGDIHLGYQTVDSGPLDRPETISSP